MQDDFKVNIFFNENGDEIEEIIENYLTMLIDEPIYKF